MCRTRWPRCREPPVGLTSRLGALLVVLVLLVVLRAVYYLRELAAAPPLSELPPPAACAALALVVVVVVVVAVLTPAPLSTTFSSRTNALPTVPVIFRCCLRSKRRTLALVIGPNSPPAGVAKPARVRSRWSVLTS